MKNKDKFWVLIPAAGVGQRMGSVVPKQYLPIAGKPILQWTIEKIQQLQNIEQLVLVLNPHDSYQKNLKLTNVQIAVGGAERFNSVLNGLKAIESKASNDDWVLVHDAVRPCVNISDLEKLIDTLSTDPIGGLLASRVKDTLKKSSAAYEEKSLSADHEVEQTLNREDYWLAATPQMFRYGLLCEALQTAITKQHTITDESAAMELMGHKVKLVEGRADNIKVTHPEDLPLVEFLLNQVIVKRSKKSQ